MIELEHYRLPQDWLPGEKQVGNVVRQRKPARRRQDLFLKGPIPLMWLEEASAVGRAGLVLGIVLWFMSGLSGKVTVALSYKRLDGFKIRRHAAYRAPQRLERAGLVMVHRHPGRCPVVTLIKELPEP